MSASTTPAAVKPSLWTRIQWGFLFWTSVALTGLGLWTSWFDPSSRLGSPFIATALGMLALWNSLRAEWLARRLAGALAAMMPALSRSTDDVLTHARVASSAAERLAAPGEGSGHPRPAERRSGPDAS
jgi:hypothetical protein